MNALNGYAIGSIGIYKLNPEPVCLPMDKETNFESDDEIWAAFKEGDEEAYEMIFKDNYQFLLNYGLRFNSNEEDVKDFIQQLFAGLWEARKRLGKNNSIRSYLVASLRRMILRGAKSNLLLLDLGGVSASFHAKLSVENRFIKTQKDREEANYVSMLMEKLPRRQREAIYLKYYGDHSFSEISEIMGINTRGVYKLIYKALNNLSSLVKNKKYSKDKEL